MDLLTKSYLSGIDHTMDTQETSTTEKIDTILLDNHIHFLVGDISSENIIQAIKWITYENLNKKPKTLTLYINSEGGDLYQAFALIDVMKRSQHSIRTIGLGTIMSAAFLIFASGTKGMRYIAPNTGIMCHQFSSEIEFKYHDIKAQMIENEYCNDRMLKILVESTGKTKKFVEQNLLPPSDVYLTAQNAIDYGVADQFFEG